MPLRADSARRRIACVVPQQEENVIDVEKYCDWNRSKVETRIKGVWITCSTWLENLLQQLLPSDDFRRNVKK